MIEYWGFCAIAKRMNWRTLKTLHRHMRSLAFPAFKRTDPRNHFRRCWYTNEALIQRWELAMANCERERLVANQEERERGKRERTAPARLPNRMN